MQQKLPKVLIVDSSSLISLERAGLLDKIGSLKFQIVVPPSVFSETGVDLQNLKVENLRGNSLKKADDFVERGIDRGEAECIVLALQLETGFIVCDDRKFLRQKYMMHERDIESIEIAGFGLFLHLFVLSDLIDKKEIWNFFDKIIAKSKWERSEVEASNYVFLREMGY